MNTIIPVNNGDALSAVRGFLHQLLEERAVDAIYCPVRLDGGAIVPTLVTEPTFIDQADPLTPIMTINGARAVSLLTRTGDQKKLGVVLRPCEIRALIELVKLKQASLENTIIIGMDCPGTCEVVEFFDNAANGNFTLTSYIESAVSLNEPAVGSLHLRSACQICTQPIPEHADIHLHLLGIDINQGIPVTFKDDLKSSLPFLKESEFQSTDIQPKLHQMLADRREARQERLDEIKEQMQSNGGFSSLFDNCIRCHNCMTVCPICYCKICLFRTQSFDHLPEHYYGVARRKGALRMLPDTTLFHMTRLNHMSLSCVSCGMCTSACPMDIPVGTIFTTIGAQVQAVFDYAPGHSVGDPIPLTTFKADEWTTVGEA
jgi:formate dehydrogenase (coenzyme F420) beta subunit